MDTWPWKQDYEDVRIKIRRLEAARDFTLALKLCREFDLKAQRKANEAGNFSHEEFDYEFMIGHYAEAKEELLKWQDTDPQLSFLAGFLEAKVGIPAQVDLEKCKEEYVSRFPKEWRVDSYWPDGVGAESVQVQCALATSYHVRDLIKLRLLRLAQSVSPNNPLVCLEICHCDVSPSERLRLIERAIANSDGTFRRYLEDWHREYQEEISKVRKQLLTWMAPI